MFDFLFNPSSIWNLYCHFVNFCKNICILAGIIFGINISYQNVIKQILLKFHIKSSILISFGWMGLFQARIIPVLGMSFGSSSTSLFRKFLMAL